MDLSELRKKSEKELKEKISKLKKDIFDERVGLRLGKIKDTSRIAKRKRDLARLMTVLREKEIIEENPDVKMRGSASK